MAFGGMVIRSGKEKFSRWNREDKDSPLDNPQGPEKGRLRVIRGGSWHSGPGCVQVYYRNGLASNWIDFAVGFRCVRDITK
ncbi:hypothetical protein ES705_35100 [subsurface metagenome]